LKGEDYDYKTRYINKIDLELNRNRERPVSFINPPLMRSQLRKKYMIKTVNKQDIHWKNLPLLVKFISEAGKLMNRYQTRLPTGVHRKLSKTVKHARNLGLLPHIDYIKPTDKIPLTSTYNDFMEDVAKVVDKKSGMIKILHMPSQVDKFSYSNYDTSVQANEVKIQQ
jgi:ribosomal protein S18